MKSLIAFLVLTTSLSAFACGGRGNSDGYCTGERVINDKGVAGVISGVLPSGEVMVRFDGYSNFNKWPVNRLALTKGCSDRYCVGSDVINDNGIRGNIAGVYQDGEVAIQFNGYNTYNKWPVNRLALTYGCTYKGFCVGDKTINDKGIVGTVAGITYEQELMIQFNGYSTYNKWPMNRMAYTSGCTADDYCVGDVIINDNGIQGTITGVYLDGEVAVNFNGYSTNNKWPTMRLAVTEACADRGLVRRN